MAKIKKVGFNFFRPIIEDGLGNEKVCNLKPIFENVRKNYIKEKEKTERLSNVSEYKIVYDYNGEPSRLAEISVDVENQFYHLVLERLDYQLPKRTTLHGDSQTLNLKDDEYIGLDVSVLYDANNHILMVQRNRSSLGPSGVETFLRTLLFSHTQENEVFSLAIISERNAQKRAFKQNAYRKVHMKVTGAKAKGLIEKLKGDNKTNVETVEISFSSGQKKKDSIDNSFAKEILEKYVNDDDVKKLEIRAREHEDSVVEPIDLIDNKLQTFTTFNFKKNRELNPISVFAEMKSLYLEHEGGFKSKVLKELRG